MHATPLIRNTLPLILSLGTALLAGQELAPIDHRVTAVAAGDAGRHTYRIPALVVCPSGTALLFSEGRIDSNNDEARIDLVVQRSGDHGRTWSTPTVVVPAGLSGHFSGNPAPLVDPVSGRVVLLFTTDNQRAWCIASSDDGLTWSTPNSLAAACAALPYPTVRIATGPGHGIALRGGRLLVPIWLSDRLRSEQDTDSTPTRHRAGVLLSDDGGNTWRAGGLVPPTIPRLHECLVTEVSDGSLLMTIRARGAGYRAVSRSQDGGETWSDASLEKELPCPTCQASILTLADGRIVFANPAVHNPTPYSAEARRRLTLRLSADAGKTWPGSWLIEAGPSGYCDLALSGDGHLLCTFETGREIYNERIDVVRIPVAALPDKPRN